MNRVGTATVDLITHDVESRPVSRRYPQESRTPRQRREHLKRCIRCDTSLHGGTGSNLAWHQLDGKWKVGPMCLTCTTTRDLAPNPDYKLRPELYTPP